MGLRAAMVAGSDTCRTRQACLVGAVKLQATGHGWVLLEGGGGGGGDGWYGVCVLAAGLLGARWPRVQPG